MKAKSILAALLLLFAGLQTAWAQGFRVYKSDGTIMQFSLRTDSIVFYDGIGTDVDFGPFTPVNQCIVGTWYKTKYETVTFREDGTTDYMAGATYEFMPYQGTIVVNNASGVPMNILKVHKLTDEMLVLSTLGSSSFDVLTRTKPLLLVTSITLSETYISLQPDETKRLTATVEPADADNPAVTWTSSNEAVAEVNSTGRVTANAYGTCTITCAATDGSGVWETCQVTVKKDNSGTINGREYVDLDLPSGTKWATCNVGASKPEEYGDYFAWGETTPKSTYDWSTYFDTDDGGSTFKKYKNNGGLTELQPEDDAATVNWGSGWKMPSRAQIEELCNGSYTTSEWTQLNGVYGRKVTSKSNGNSIFLPAAGLRWYGELYDAGSRGGYWSSSLDPSYNNDGACYLYFDAGYWDWGSDYRYGGPSVRAVRP